MTVLSFLCGPEGRRLAFVKTKAQGPQRGAGLFYLGGFQSDMTGTKAMDFERRAAAAGLDYLRFDYSGHGASSGAIEDGAIGDWFADALALFDAETSGPQVLIGSSMGGWIGLLLARARPARVAGFVGIAAAPDFTEDLLWGVAKPAEQATILDKGILWVETTPGFRFPVTRRLIEEGRAHLLLRAPLPLPFPAHLFHGSEDREVPLAVGRALAARMEAPSAMLTEISGGDHRLSRPEDLAQIWAAALAFSRRAAA